MLITGIGDLITMQLIWHFLCQLLAYYLHQYWNDGALRHMLQLYDPLPSRGARGSML